MDMIASYMWSSEEYKCPTELITRLRSYQTPARVRDVTDPLILDIVVRCLQSPLQRSSATELLYHPTDELSVN